MLTMKKIKKIVILLLLQTNNNNSNKLNNEINTVEYLRIALSYVLQHDQSGCSGVTETGVVEHWRKEMLHALQLSSIDQIRISTIDGKIPKDDLVLLRAWTICPAYVMQYGTERLTHHLLTATTFLEKNNEVAVQYMVLQTLEDLLIEHPTSLIQDFKTYIKLSKSVDPDTNTKDVANTLPAISTDHLLMVRYTTFVKASVHLGLLHAMRTMFDIYVDAAHDWMSKENESVTRHLHDANVIAYDQWMKELEVWKMEWMKWKKKVDEVVAL